ncbi:Integral membrane protein [Pseudonocardia sp. Ae406_Ps2]|uniref:Pr6Pr family membrane protein n=1 Tax=unclassified Pseudonocardia TaxID=2619320 RepID=UPI0002F62E60|nr:MULTISPECIES: Pr6Pr family membrane protein [unclassified Pseudonocardia]OLM01436.1 Integral membrane protein [Pseudonocardia sp. Ae406_Ps2]OLM06764.1 Integral membrane protein [Pseudonocardia sp. Ae331_Ps2]OLM14943.1 Integral membrane protein [Pseudonocardia sp. Ae505_Ps2]OLM23008.1 Integral membrane protein [Pseudonocardia sp. Ae706_Ps2]
MHLPAPRKVPVAVVAVVLRGAVVACVLAALVVVELTSRSGVAWRLTTFTYQVNLLAAAFYLWTLLGRRYDARPAVRGAVVVYLLVAGLVWVLFLSGRSTGFTPANVLLHIVVPVLALADWVLVRPARGGLRWWHPPVWLLFPAAYLGLALAVLNGAGRRAPYYFLDPDAVGAGGLAWNVLRLAAGFLVLGYLVLLAGRTGSRVPGRAVGEVVPGRA